MTTTILDETSSELSEDLARPVPLEQSDPELAEHFRLIANRLHPSVKTVVMDDTAIMLIRPDGARVIKRRAVVGRNDPCRCGSGKKFKKCCG